ncbi:hypothetical protein JTB14_018393 [Gonioctena quinquepunctata]|nr:hypothetical protein JTB14_018393 [Gonioctena quinquepunctata]
MFHFLQRNANQYCRVTHFRVHVLQKGGELVQLGWMMHFAVMRAGSRVLPENDLAADAVINAVEENKLYEDIVNGIANGAFYKK